MANYRRGRINDAVAKELAIALRDVRDPRIAGNFVSITRAEVAPDLKVAKIYFSAMGDKKEAQTALTHAAGLFCRGDDAESADHARACVLCGRLD